MSGKRRHRYEYLNYTNGFYYHFNWESSSTNVSFEPTIHLPFINCVMNHYYLNLPHPHLIPWCSRMLVLIVFSNGILILASEPSGLRYELILVGSYLLQSVLPRFVPMQVEQSKHYTLRLLTLLLVSRSLIRC